MNRLVLLALGTAALTACGVPAAINAMNELPTIEDDYSGPTEAFARGAHFEDVSTRYGTHQGIALGSDDMGAVGMVGMVCSFATADAELRYDVDSDEGDEYVVDAMAELDGFSTVAIDGNQITVSVFPTEWNGATTVDISPPGGDVVDAGMVDGGVVVLRHNGNECIVERYLHGSDTASAATSLGAPCISGVSTDVTTGTAYASTDRGTYSIDLDGLATEISAPAETLAASAGSLALASGESLRGLVDGAEWSTDLTATITGIEWVGGTRVVASVSTASGPELVIVDGLDGTILERVSTQGTPIEMSASPEGGILAVQSEYALHIVRILD